MGKVKEQLLETDCRYSAVESTEVPPVTKPQSVLCYTHAPAAAIAEDVAQAYSDLYFDLRIRHNALLGRVAELEAKLANLQFGGR